MPKKTYGAVEDYELEELAVALPDIKIVEKALNDDLHVTTYQKDSDKRLGLALLGLGEGEVTKASAEWRREDPGLMRRVRGAKWPRGPRPKTGSLDLDLLLFKLRDNLSEAYGRWIPEIGKNRMISPVRGFPYVSGCTDGHPDQVGFDVPKSGVALGWDPRPTEPGQGVRVGLLDTPLYPNPWLAGGYLATGSDLLKSPGQGQIPQDLAGHGTFIAGLILRRAPGAGLIVRPVMGPNALGTTWDVAKIMAEFADTDVNILNLSFGCYTDDSQPPLVLAKAVSLLSPKILLVAAAGNHGNIEKLRADHSPLAAPWTANLTNKTPVWPAAFPQVTAVGATDAQGKLAEFSPNVPWVDVTAPGVDVQSTYLSGEVSLSLPGDVPRNQKNQTEKFNGYARWKGTSFAAATVSGAIAANIESGRNAWEAREIALNDPTSDIQAFDKLMALET